VKRKFDPDRELGYELITSNKGDKDSCIAALKAAAKEHLPPGTKYRVYSLVVGIGHYGWAFNYSPNPPEESVGKCNLRAGRLLLEEAVA